MSDGYILQKGRQQHTVISLRDAAKIVEHTLTKNSPAILTAIGVVGTLTTAYLTGKATIKAMAILDQEQLRRNLARRDGYGDIPTSREKILLVWKEYIPPAMMAALTVGSIIGSNYVSSRRAAALAVVYSLAEKSFDEYRAKVIEKLGAKKEEGVRDEVAMDRVAKNPPSPTVVIESGEVLCHEAFTGRYFTCSMERIRAARNEFNHQVMQDFSASLTDFYYLIGLARTDISDNIGWNSDKLMELQFTSGLTPDGRPCMVFTYSTLPKDRYHRVG